MTDVWCFGRATEADFEPLLVLRTEVMREHLERVGRYTPERSRQMFRTHFNEAGTRLILWDGVRVGCVGFRKHDHEIRIDSFYLERRLLGSGLGTKILKALLAEADAAGLPVRLEGWATDMVRVPMLRDGPSGLLSMGSLLSCLQLGGKRS